MKIGAPGGGGGGAAASAATIPAMSGPVRCFGSSSVLYSFSPCRNMKHIGKPVTEYRVFTSALASSVASSCNRGGGGGHVLLPPRLLHLVRRGVSIIMV